MEYNKGHLESIYDSINESRKEREEYIKKVQKIDNDIQIRVLEYRIASVYRVLDFINHKHFASGKNLEKYINHCMNKLMGNIDGIEFDLEENNYD